MGDTRKDRIQLLVRRIFLVITDIILINGSVFLSLIMRFEINIASVPEEYIQKYIVNVIPFTIVTLIIFWCFRMYHSLWQYASIAELYKIVEACVVAELAHLCVTSFMGWMLPRSCYFTSGVFLIVAMSASRFMYRLLRQLINEYRHTSEQVKIMIIGAGEATSVLMREISNSRYLDNSKVVCIIDDDLGKVGKYIRGVKIVGTRDHIKEYARYYDIDEIIFAIPSASTKDKREILNICKETSCNLKILPGVYQMVDGEINIKDLRNVDVLDLLGRDPVKVDIESIMGYVKDKTVLVTGGGGSIGSELCRQLVSHKPKCLVIFDIYENNAYDIQQELKIKYPDARVLRMDADTTTRKGSHEKYIQMIENGEVNIIVGTQMISKGLDFPNVTVVGVINADESLNVPDFRSGEYTYSLLSQVSGRAGRKNGDGKVILQTFNKDNETLNLVKQNNYKGLYTYEMNIRRELKYPPYFYITTIKIASKDYDEASKEATKACTYLRKNLENTYILGPTTARMFKVKNIYRFQIILKYKNFGKIKEALTQLDTIYKTNTKVNIEIDNNPCYI